MFCWVKWFCASLILGNCIKNGSWCTGLWSQHSELPINSQVNKLVIHSKVTEAREVLLQNKVDSENLLETYLFSYLHMSTEPPHPRFPVSLSLSYILHTCKERFFFLRNSFVALGSDVRITAPKVFKCVINKQDSSREAKYKIFLHFLSISNLISGTFR